MNIVEPLRDKDDIQAMKDYLSSWNEKYYMLFLLGINTGFRVGDILKLKVKDVQGWHIKVREQKTGKYKSIKMTRPLKNELREFVKDKELHEYLFQSRVRKNKRSAIRRYTGSLKELLKT
ncbi:prophage LambdaSa2, site-specific recombinase phage integrase family protein [Streptococcus pneumoniae]|nr:prophage LambdaSa2, site-specific recombinase phage integrase family protein [Streptococcus pneumoniae]